MPIINFFKRKLDLKFNILNIDFNAIESVTFFKRDEITTDLICCDIVVHVGGETVVWFMHEEKSEWDVVISRLEVMANFDKAWREKVVHSPFASNVTIAFKRSC